MAEAMKNSLATFVKEYNVAPRESSRPSEVHSTILDDVVAVDKHIEEKFMVLTDQQTPTEAGDEVPRLAKVADRMTWHMDLLNK